MQSLIRNILKKYWGYDHFRPLQEEVILSTLHHNDTLALFPTGGGKSICFQTPALAMDGICLVISPLIALMKDQVENLKKRNIKAAALYSGMLAQEMDNVISNMLYDKEFKLLYISPERLQSAAFIANLQRMKISMIAVDEAHCISQWGYDFRPPYLEIAQIRAYFPKAPILALTATATPEVAKDIQEKLQFKRENIFRKSFKRDNLIYYAVKEPDKFNRILRIIERYPGSGIIYARNRKKTKECAEMLQQYKISADYYHAGLDTVSRDKKQKEWVSGKTKIIVTTNAFGMGIDKPDVRFVIHIDIPDSLEAYFQEAGRAGRDEQPAVAILLYDESDFRTLYENFQNSYPPIEIIKNAYQQLFQFYNIPINDGANTVHSFNFEDIVKKIEIKPAILQSILHFFERWGYIILSENAGRAATIFIPLNTKEIELFYKDQPENHVDFFKILLRSYSGLFSHSVKINTKEMAARIGWTEETVDQKLQYFHQLGAVHYMPAIETSTIIFLQNRTAASHFYIDKDAYHQRKEVAQKRMNAILQFIQTVSICRSVVLLEYFGEKYSTPCHKCDTCLHWQREQVSVSEYKKIKKAALALKNEQQQDIKTLITALSKQFEKELVIHALQLMQDRKEL